MTVLRARFLILSAIAFLLIGGNAIAAYGQDKIQARVEEILSSEPMSSGVCAVYAKRMNGDLLADYESGRKLLPASTVKLITTGLALKVLGPEYRYVTQLAYSGTISDSTLNGDLYIIGGGDPMTAVVIDRVPSEGKLFREWKDALLEAGIRRISGRVIADPRYFSDPALENPGWSFEDLGFGYGAAPSGLNFNENIQVFHISPGPSEMTAPLVVAGYPETPWLQISVNAITSSSASYDDIYCVNSPFAAIADFRGAFPLASRGYSLECSNRFAPLTCAYRFCKYLNANGVNVSSGYADIDAQGRLRTAPGLSYGQAVHRPSTELVNICNTESLPLKELVRRCNYRSDNFIAETLLRTIGLKTLKSSRYDSCRVAANRVLASMGLDVSNSCRLYDGSGLARKNYISPRFFVEFLRAMARTTVFEDYYASLPVPGMDKTSLMYRFKDTPDAVRGRIRMKSGSMNGVRCFCGYIESSDSDPDKRVVFSVLTNNITTQGRKVYDLIEEIILAIMEE